jgi:AcrR family transcriptional regulator
MAYRVTDKVRAKAAAARETIVQAAADQLAEGGYASTGMQAIARRAGVATGTVYRHFPGKAELFSEVFRRASEQEIAVLAEVAGDRRRGAADRIAACIETFARRALADRVRAYALIAEPVDPEVEAERLAFRRDLRDLLAGILRDGIARYELEAQDPDVVASALVGALAEALVGPLSDPRRQAHATLVRTLVAFSVHAVQVRARQYVTR